MSKQLRHVTVVIKYYHGNPATSQGILLWIIVLSTHGHRQCGVNSKQLISTRPLMAQV